MSRHLEVEPHEAMVRAREREHANRRERGIRVKWPVDAGADHGHPPPRQHVVDAQVAGIRRVVGEVGRVVRGIALVRRVGTTLECGLLHASGAGRDRAGIDARVLQQLLNCALDAVAVDGVGVLVTRDNEVLAAFEAAGLAGIVGDVPAAARNDVVGPEADLVVIAGAVAIFGAVETAFLTAGMDGFFTDNPDIGVATADDFEDDADDG
jgi:hypothetical protein